MGNTVRLLLIAILGVASMATSRVADDPVDAGPATADAGQSALDADPSAPDANPSAPDAGPDEYRATALIGALDRIVIVKADRTLDVCAVLRLVSPGPSGSFGVATPENWGVEYAGVSQGTTDCLTTRFPESLEYSTGGSGSVTFTVPDGMYYPTTLSTDSTIDFDTSSAPSWLPASVAFEVTDLPVQ